MDADRDAKRKVFQELLDFAREGMGEQLRQRAPKFKKVEAAAPADHAETKPKCRDCEEGACEEHDADGFSSKLKNLYEQMTEE
jgi:hypothetical protein